MKTKVESVDINPSNVRMHNSTGKCEECDLQVGVVRKFRKQSFTGKLAG